MFGNSIVDCIHRMGEQNKMPTYNKLVRDKIPTMIEKIGKQCKTSLLSEVEFEVELKAKLKEELAELLAAETSKDAIEEMADILEVMKALAKLHNATLEDIEKVRQVKEKERGGFQERIFLIDVDDE